MVTNETDTSDCYQSAGLEGSCNDWGEGGLGDGQEQSGVCPGRCQIAVFCCLATFLFRFHLDFCQGTWGAVLLRFKVPLTVYFYNNIGLTMSPVSPSSFAEHDEILCANKKCYFICRKKCRYKLNTGWAKSPYPLLW